MQFLQDLNTLKQVQEDRGGGEEEADAVHLGVLEDKGGDKRND